MQLNRELEFTDPIKLPIGYQIQPVDLRTDGGRFKSSDVEAIKACAKRVYDDRGEWPVICVVNGVLRVIRRDYLVDGREAK